MVHSGRGEVGVAGLAAGLRGETHRVRARAGRAPAVAGAAGASARNYNKTKYKVNKING